MPLKEDCEEIEKLADQNIRQYKRNLKFIDELLNEIYKCGLIKKKKIKPQKTIEEKKEDFEIIKKLEKEKYYLGKDKKNGIIQQYRRHNKRPNGSKQFS